MDKRQLGKPMKRLLDEATICLSRPNWWRIMTMFDIHNVAINNKLRKIPDLNLLFEILMTPQKDFFEVYGQFGHVSSKSFASLDLSFGYFAPKKKNPQLG